MDKIGWANIKTAAGIVGLSRQTIYTRIEKGLCRHKWEKTQHLVRLEDLVFGDIVKNICDCGGKFVNDDDENDLCPEREAEREEYDRREYERDMQVR